MILRFLAFLGISAVGIGLLMANRERHGGNQKPIAASVPSPAPALESSWSDSFGDPQLQWTRFEEGDFQDRSAEVIGGRLRLRAATVGTLADTVKIFGVRTVGPFGAGRFSVTLDWNRQKNGCYLSGGIVLTPHATSGNPLKGQDWVKVEYVGVPPGQNGRLVVASRRDGANRILFTEGWPGVKREGRPLALQDIAIVLRNGAFDVWENGSKAFASGPNAVSFDAAHAYLFISSHSNFPARELHFDDFHWEREP